MQRILNNPDNIVDEMLQGFLKAHSDLVEGGENPRVVKVKNINLPGGNSAVFTDGEQISEYAKEAVLKLSGAEIINGFDDNTFKPRSTATRAQAAKLLCHIYELSGGAV